MFREFKSLLLLALPLVLAQLAQNATSFVDTVMVGKLGNEALAGIAIGGLVFMFVAIVLSGVVLGVSAVVSQATGAGDQPTCGRAVRQGFWLAGILWLPAMILFWNIYPILIWFRQPEAAALASSEYLRAISWGLLPGLAAFALRGLLEGKSNTRPIMLIFSLGVVINIFLNDTLMFGKYGLPALGLVGTGYASSIGLTVNFVLLSLYASRRYPELQLFSSLRFPDFSMMRELLRIGGPIAIALGFEASMFSAAGIAMGTLGEIPLAAHQIALQTASVSFMVPLGIAIAASVRVGQKTGAGDHAGAKLAGYVGIASCALVMLGFAILFWIFPKLIIGLYIDTTDPANAEVLRLGIQFLAIAGLFQVVDGIQVAANLALRGIKDTFASMLITLISYWGVGGTTGAILCFGLGYDGAGLWLGMTAGLATAALLLCHRFRSQFRGAAYLERQSVGDKIKRSSNAVTKEDH
ncbi:MAG: MATE family efflux transporter [Planctomycetota bacterium]